jgi:hypothetical protein
MPFRSRVSQLLALTLLLLSPGAGGLVLEISHPCPGDAAPEASGTGHSHHSDSHHSGHQGPEHGNRCCCFGACSLALQHPGLPEGAALATLLLATSHSPELLQAAEPLVGTPSRLLPPATAPPIGLS